MVFIIFMWLGTCYVVNCGWARMYVLLDVRMVSKTGTSHENDLFTVLLTQAFLNDLIDTFGMVGTFET